jgi:ABC-2 type transport system permease protein
VNIVFRELRANLKSLLIWSGIVILFSITGYGKFTAYYNNPEMLQVLNSFPPQVIDALGMSSFNLTTVSGFYGIMVVYTSLMLAIAAVMWGTGVIAKEERDKTVEFSLTLPVTRSRLITGKTAAMVIDCIILLLVTWGISLALAQKYGPDAVFYRFVGQSMLALFIIQMIFLALGVFLGAAVKRHKQSSSIAIGILLAAYFASIIAALSKNLEWLKYVSPFKYFEAGVLFREARLESGYVLLSLALVVVFLAGAYVTYSRRDLYI